MTTTTTAVPTAIEMSRQIVDTISQAVASGGDAATARAKLAETLRNQGGAMAAAGATPMPEPPPPVPTGPETIKRPNGQDYWVRKLGAHTDVMALRLARKEGINAFAYGPPGTGKTALFEAAYAGADLSEEEAGLYTIQGTGDTDTSDFIGGYVQLPGGVYEWVDGALILAMEAGKPLFVDEIGLIDTKVTAVAYGVMDGRGELRITQNPERGVVVAKPGFYVCAATNPNAPGVRMSEALLSRFPLQFEMGTDYSLAKRLGVPAKMVTAAQNMQRKFEKDELGWAPQLRELLAFRAIAATMGEDVALRNIISGAPEIDRPVVQDVLSRGYGRSIAALSVD